MKEPVIEFADFGFKYDAQAEPTLFHVNLKIYQGEKVLIVGPSGCGKSTIINCINGLIPFTYKGESTGSLKVNGRDTSQLSVAELSKTVGTVLQDSDAQFIGMTVKEDIAFALENQCLAKPEMISRITKAAQIVGISDHMDYAPTELSGGQKQRVSIAGIMVDEVEVMLFDEPLANLDPATGKKAMEFIDQLTQQTRAAIIIVEHRLEDVLHRDVDRIVLMSEGRILYDGSPDDLLAGDLLKANGIREPLYLTALKYAGVSITSDMQPRSINTIKLSPPTVGKVKAWYHEALPARPVSGQPVFLQLSGVHFAYNNRTDTLKGVDLTIHKGELMALVGKNGAGKSTLSKVICGFEKNQSGSMQIDGTDLMALSIKQRADRIGFVMQNPNKMISKVMIFDEVALGLRTRGIDEETIRAKVEEVLKICGLYQERDWPISALSYGQKKRVTIAAILVLDPEMIILDEPTAGQDFRHYNDIMEFLLSLNRRGLTIMMITHDMHLMLEYADRSIVFCDGRVIADTTSAQVLTDPAIIEKASLKETSLYDLALKCGIADASGFVQHFVDYDRKVRQS